MPRLSSSLFRQARRSSTHLATLLPACKDLSSAQNELRWIKSHVDETCSSRKASLLLKQLCKRRGQGVPLQYILKSQPFGSLDIKCRPSVLIPRLETEAYTCHLADLIKCGGLLGNSVRGDDQELSIVDFCTGTGCIPLLLFSTLRKIVKNIRVQGVDISTTAVSLARENIIRNHLANDPTKTGGQQSLTITKGDVFNDEEIGKLAGTTWDIVVSNPPYISLDVWNYGRGQLGSSVRKHEPRLALIPDGDLPKPANCNPEDAFYARLLDVAWRLKAKVLLLEIGDESQAKRVLQLYHQHELHQHSHLEVWRDYPDIVDGEDGQLFNTLKICDPEGLRVVPVKGSGLIRSIFIRRESLSKGK